MKKLKQSFSLFLLTGFLFVSFSFVFAQQPETQYPNVPGAESPNVTRELPKVIKYVFILGLAVSGFIAFGSLIYGGVQYLLSAGNPGALNNAKDQVLASLLGIAVLFGSYILLSSINPQLVILETPTTGANREGVVLYSQARCPDAGEEGKDFIRAKNSLSALPDTFTKKFDPSGNIIGDKPVKSVKFLSPKDEVEVILYSENDYNREKIAWKSENYTGNDICVSESQLNAAGEVKTKSISLNWRSPGVYLFTENNCRGEARLFVGNTASFGDFDDKARSLKIIPSLEKELLPGPVDRGQPPLFRNKVKEKFGAILYENTNFKDRATVFTGSDDPTVVDAQCIDLGNYGDSCSNTAEPYCVKKVGQSASSLRVFKQNVLGGDPGGEGVTAWANYQFNEQAAGTLNDLNRHCGPANATNSEFQSTLGNGKPAWINGSQVNINGPGFRTRNAGEPNESTEDCRYTMAQKHMSSISIDGNYMGVLFRTDGRGEAFVSPGDFRLTDNHIGNDSASYLLVVPLKP